MTFCVMAAVGAPFKWKKQRGGLASEWVGIYVDYREFSMGLSQRRSDWMVGWIDSLLERKEVEFRELAAGLGRLGFAALALPWEKPFLGPLYAWSSAIRGNHGKLNIPWAVLFILKWIRGRLASGSRMEKVKCLPRGTSAVQCVWTDAKASDNLAECEWFAEEVTEKEAPWLKFRGGNPKRVIAALEMLATLVALKLWLKRSGSQMQVSTNAFTDNKGNEFILKKGMSTKYPLTLLVIEACELMRACDGFATLSWVRRDGNQTADDLTNGKFEDFDEQRRRRPWKEDMQWLVLDELERDSRVLYEEIQEKKARQAEARREGANVKLGRKRKFFQRWTS